MKSPKKISFIISLFLIVSCSDSLDFNQFEDYVPKSKYTTPLIYFTVFPAQFFDSTRTIQQNSISDSAVISDFDDFQDNLIRGRVVKIVLNAELRNAFDRDVIVQIEFLDENAVIYSFRPIIVTNNHRNFLPFEEEIIIASNSNVLNTAQIRVTVTLENIDIQMNPNDMSEFEFKSAITLFLESNL
jgi:hypothetical protein